MKDKERMPFKRGDNCNIFHKIMKMILLLIIVSLLTIKNKKITIRIS